MKELWMRFPDGRRKALTLSYDDGVEQDIRLIEIMNRHGLKGTFNLSSGLYAADGQAWPKGQVHRRLSRKAALEMYAGCGQEIAVHALYHGDLPHLPPAHALWQVLRDREQLENDFGRIIRGMAYPYGTVSDELAKALEGCGMAYARTVESTHRFDIPTDWLKLPATCHHDDPQLMQLAQTFVSEQSQRPWLFYLWGHSYEFEAHDNWQIIEAFAALTGGRDDVWYASNIEICDYVKAWRGMHASADGRRLHNASCMKLWLEADGRPHCIASGETLVL